MALTHLQQLIIERIQREGPLTFAEYMRMALYEPHYGYYMTGSTNIGFEGADFLGEVGTPLTFCCTGARGGSRRPGSRDTKLGRTRGH